MTFCPECGKSVAPKAKFCRNCGASQLEDALSSVVPEPVAAPVAVPAPSPAPLPMPAPVMGQPSGVRLCTACGNVIQPGDKYCSKCLVIVRDNPPQAAAPAPSPVQSFPAAAPGSYVCASCGSPITGTEKFCVICGTPVVASRVPAPAQQPLVQKT